MEEGIFSGWLKHDGEQVAAGDLLFVLENDKASQEVESLDSGVLHIPADSPKPGDKVTVGQLLGYLVAPGESIPVAGLPAAVTLVPPDTPSALPVVGPVNVSSPLPGAETPIISPRARRVAAQLGVNWMSLSGTGRDGRIREADIRNAAAMQQSKGLSSMRRTIAERTLASQQKTVAVTLHTTADATSLVQLRGQLKSGEFRPRSGDATNRPPFEKGGQRSPQGLQGGLDEENLAETIVPTYNDILVKLVAAALQKHPVLNSRWEGETIRTGSSIHIGIAVDTEPGLLVPVIHDVTALTLHEVALCCRNLIERAHSKRLNADELSGGTFTVTSLGAFGIDAFTPIINYPECAILGVGRILRQPVAVEETIALRDIITLSLTFDHRALDGAPAARFLQTLTKLVESPFAALGIGSLY